MYLKAGDPIPKQINKLTFETYVYNKLNSVISNLKIISIFTLFIQEVVSDLIKGKTLKIFNFGKVRLKKMPPRKYFDFVNQKVMQSNGKNSLRFTLIKKLNYFLTDSLDVERTFDASNEEK